MKPIRIGDLAFRAMLNVVYSSKASMPRELFDALDQLLDSEAKARGFEDWEVAAKDYRVHGEIANGQTPFDQLTKERAIAIKALRVVDAMRPRADDEPVEIMDAISTAHNALDEIGDDRVSEL